MLPARVRAPNGKAVTTELGRNVSNGLLGATESGQLTTLTEPGNGVGVAVRGLHEFMKTLPHGREGPRQAGRREQSCPLSPHPPPISQIMSKHLSLHSRLFTWGATSCCPQVLLMPSLCSLLCKPYYLPGSHPTSRPRAEPRSFPLPVTPSLLLSPIKPFPMHHLRTKLSLKAHCPLHLLGMKFTAPMGIPHLTAHAVPLPARTRALGPSAP